MVHKIYTHQNLSSYNSTGENKKVAHIIPYTNKWHTTQFLKKIGENWENWEVTQLTQKYSLLINGEQSTR